jgi:hypothetical protein
MALLHWQLRTRTGDVEIDWTSSELVVAVEGSRAYTRKSSILSQPSDASDQASCCA